MNTLSIFLYFSDTLPGLAKFMFWIGIICFLLMLILNFFVVLENGERVIRNRHKNEEYKEPILKHWGYVVTPIFAFILCFTSFLIPSKVTFLAIAASEIGEQIVKTPEIGGIVKDSLSLVKKKLEEELEKEMPKPNNSNNR